MDKRLELCVERTLLEFRLVMLEQAIQEQRGMDAPALGERMEGLFARLQLVNAKLAALRSTEALAWPSPGSPHRPIRSS